MRTRNPDQRLRGVRAASEAPDHLLEHALWNLFHGTSSDTVVGYAYEIYTAETEREIMQAFLLARASNEDVEKILRIPATVVQAYKHLFFDVNLFRDELDILSWIQEYPGTPRGKQLLQSASMHGLEMMKWIYGRGEVTVDPQRVMQQAMTDAYFRGRANREYPLGRKELAAARDFMNSGAKMAESLSRNSGPSGAESLKIKLLYRDTTTPVEEIPTEDLLH